jgi:hypothetical protein
MACAKESTAADRPITGVTYDGTPLTNAVALHYDIHSQSAEIWYLKDPTTESSLLIEVTHAGKVTDPSAYGMDLSNIDTTGAILVDTDSNSGGATEKTLTVEDGDFSVLADQVTNADNTQLSVTTGTQIASTDTGSYSSQSGYNAGLTMVVNHTDNDNSSTVMASFNEASGTLSADINDAASITESVSRFYSLLCTTINDSVTLAEATLRLGKLVITVADTGTIIEDLTVEEVVVGLSIDINDSISIEEATSFLGHLSSVVDDEISVLELIDAVIDKLYVSLDDTVNIVELIATLGQLYGAVNDDVVTAENTARIGEETASLFDAISILEAAVAYGGNVANISDSIGLTEALSFLGSLSGSMNDSISILEDVVRSLSGEDPTADIDDTITVVEYLISIGKMSRSINDTIGITEYVNTAGEIYISINDAATVAEDIEVVESTGDLTKTINDTITIAEVLSFLGQLSLSIADTISIAEAVTAAESATEITVGNTSSRSSPSTVQQYSWSHTCASGSNILFVLVSGRESTDADRPVSGITYDGNDLTLAKSYQDDPNNYGCEIWYLKNPTTESSLTIEVTHEGFVSDMSGGGIDLSGVDLNDIVEASDQDTLTGTSITMSVGAGDAIVACFVANESDATNESITTGIEFHEADVGEYTVSAGYNLDVLSVIASGQSKLRAGVAVSLNASYASALSKALFDSISLTEATNFLGALSGSVNDSITILEDIIASVTAFATANINDTITVAEYLAVSGKLTVGINENILLSEALVFLGRMEADLTENITISESLLVLQRMMQTISDSVSVEEYFDGAVSLMSAQIADGFFRRPWCGRMAGVFGRAHIFTGGTGEEEYLLFKKITDIVTILEHLSFLGYGELTATEIATVSEAIVTLGFMDVSINDTISIVEDIEGSVGVGADLLRAVFDAIGLTEAFGTLGYLEASVSDSISIEESLEDYSLPIEVGDIWRYFKGTSEPLSTWKDLAFDDSNWLLGRTGIGYSSTETYTTEIPDMEGNYAALYCRREFNVANLASLLTLQLGMIYDDGFIAWINGEEVARSPNMVQPTYAYNEWIGSGHDELLPEELWSIDVTTLSNIVEGRNVLAIQLQNTSPTSSDACIVPRLTVTEVAGAPVADIQATPTSADEAPVLVTFDGGDSYDPNGTIVDYEWDFGDGSDVVSGPSSTTTHTYTTTGRFTATLTVTDNDNNTDVDIVYISVGVPALGYEGFGTVTSGAESAPGGYTTYHVTSLADSGAGTLRDAVSEGSRRIVFDVGGDIYLSSNLIIRSSYLTIDGSTAPSPGITVNTPVGGYFIIRGACSDIIVHNIRAHGHYLGPVLNSGDLLSLDGEYGSGAVENVIIDHCTMLQAGDGICDIRGDISNVTYSWNLLFDTAYVGSFSDSVGRHHISFHHNVLARGDQRMPKIGNENGSTTLDFDFVNNVIYGWGRWEDADGYGLRIDANGSTLQLRVTGNWFESIYAQADPTDAVDWQVRTGASVLFSDNVAPTGSDLGNYGATPPAIPAWAQVTTYLSNQLWSDVVPYVGTQYPRSDETSLLNEIAEALQ